MIGPNKPYETLNDFTARAPGPSLWETRDAKKPLNPTKL
jgi:hypothetical protein